MKKDLVTKENNEVVVHAESGSMGAADNIESQDIVIPRVWLMQSNSTLVEDEIWKSGDFVHSIDEVLLGNGRNTRKEEKPINFIPFALYRTMRTLENKQWIKTEDYHPSMRSLPYEEIVTRGEEMITIHRQITMNYLGILADQVREIELDGEKIAIGKPVCICFKSSAGNKAAKDMATKINDLAVFRKPSWFKNFILSAEPKENSKGKKFYAWNAKQGETSTEAQQKAAAMLCEQYNKNKVSFRVDDTDEEVAPEENAKPQNSEFRDTASKKDIRF